MTISIITATYNSGKTIQSTLESILRQTYQDYELIIKDGQSKDDTLKICREYESRFGGRMRIVSSKDSGIYNAMNQGITLSSGQIVGILNSDDFYTSDNVLQKIAEEFASNPELEAVYGDIHYVDPDNLKKCVRYYSSMSFKPWQMRLGFMPAHPSFYCKRASYERFAFWVNGSKEFYDPSYKIAADFEFLLRLIFVGRVKCRYIAMDFVTMRTGGASSSGIKSHLQINKDHLRAFKQNKVFSNIIFLSVRYICKLWDMINVRRNL